MISWICAFFRYLCRDIIFLFPFSKETLNKSILWPFIYLLCTLVFSVLLIFIKSFLCMKQNNLYDKLYNSTILDIDLKKRWLSPLLCYQRRSFLWNRIIFPIKLYFYRNMSIPSYFIPSNNQCNNMKLFNHFYKYSVKLSHCWFSAQVAGDEGEITRWWRVHNRLGKGGQYGVYGNMLDCDIIVNEFELQSCYYVHVWTNALWKNRIPFIPPTMI